LLNLIRAAHYDVRLALQFGKNHGIPVQEVVALWIDACLAITTPEPLSPSAHQQLNTTLPAEFDERYCFLVPSVLENLSQDAVEELLLEKVLPCVSPYDYSRIEFILGFVKHHPQTRKKSQVLQVLNAYTRVSQISKQEGQAIQAWKCKLQRKGLRTTDAEQVYSEPNT